MDDDRQKISPYSLVVVAALLASSQFWQPWANSYFLDTSFSSPAILSSEENVWEPLSSNPPESLLRLEPSEELKKLRYENSHLKKMLTEARIIRKNAGEDCRLLAVEVTGDMWRLGSETAIINSGEDYGLKEGDWLISRGTICGKVISVSQHIALVSDLSGADIKTFVKVDGVEGEVIWEGCGKGKGWVRVRRDNHSSLVGRQVRLSSPQSDFGSFLVGEVITEQADRRGGWMLLEVQGRQIPHHDILFVVQRHESSATDLFAQRTRLDALRKEVRQLENNKLRMELVKP
jgi:cell shape-determining protein MreC